VYPGASVCTWVCVRVALLIEHARRMRHIIKSFVASLAPLRFSTLSHKVTFFGRVTEHEMCVLILCTIFV
jgi:hypothetical protein